MAPAIANAASAAISAAEHTARRKREADAAQAAALDTSVSISDVLEGVAQCLSVIVLQPDENSAKRVSVSAYDGRHLLQLSGLL